MYLENITMICAWRALAGNAFSAQKVRLCTIFPMISVHNRGFYAIDVHYWTFCDRKEESIRKRESVENVSITCEKGGGKEVESMYINSGKVNYKKA